MSADPNVHVGTHPSGHINRTAVNEDNPIFGRPADPVITEVSVGQAAMVQSEKTPRETVVSPLINEEVASPVATGAAYPDGSPVAEADITQPTLDGDPSVALPGTEGTAIAALPSAEDLDAIAADAEAQALTKSSGDDQDAGDWTKTAGAGLSDDTSSV